MFIVSLEADAFHEFFMDSSKWIYNGDRFLF